MTRSLALALAAVLTALPLAAAAQSSSPAASDLSLEMKRKRAVVLPKPGADEVRADADRAVSEFAAGRPTGRVVRETSPVRPPSRPDLDYDVKSGIQTRSLNNAIRGR